jgi:hypothetical protein
MRTRSNSASARCIAPRLVDGFVAADRLDDLRADRIDRVERQQRLLEDHRRRPCRDRPASSRCGIASTSCPPPAPAAHARAALGVQPQQGAQVTLLPEPDSPISATTSPASAQVDAADGMRTGLPAAEGDATRRRTIGSTAEVC